MLRLRTVILIFGLSIYSCDVIKNQLENGEDTQEQAAEKPEQPQNSDDQNAASVAELTPSQSKMVNAIGQKLDLSEEELKLVTDLFKRDHKAIEPMFKMINSLNDLKDKTLAKYIKKKWILKSDAEAERDVLKKQIAELAKKIVEREATIRAMFGEPETDALELIKNVLAELGALKDEKATLEQQLSEAIANADTKQEQIDILIPQIEALNKKYDDREAALKAQLGNSDLDVMDQIIALQGELQAEKDKLNSLKSELGSLFSLSEPTAEALINRTKFLLGMTDDQNRKLVSLYITDSQSNDSGKDKVTLLIGRSVALRAIGVYGDENPVKRDITHAVHWKYTLADRAMPAFKQNEMSANIFTGMKEAAVKEGEPSNAISVSLVTEVKKSAAAYSAPVEVITGYSTEYIVKHVSLAGDYEYSSPVPKGRLSRLEVTAVVKNDLNRIVGSFDVTHAATFRSSNSESLEILGTGLIRRGLIRGMAEGTTQVAVSVDGRALTKDVPVGPAEALGFIFGRGEWPDLGDEIICGMMPSVADSYPSGGDSVSGYPGSPVGKRFIGGRVDPELVIYYSDCTISMQNHVVSYTAETPLSKAKDAYDNDILVSNKAGEDMAIEFTHPTMNDLARLNSYSISVEARELTHVEVVENGRRYYDFWIDEPCYEIEDGMMKDQNQTGPGQNEWDTRTRVSFGISYVWNGCLREYVHLTDQGLPQHITFSLTENGQVLDQALGSFGTGHEALTFLLAIDRGNDDVWVEANVTYDFSERCFNTDTTCLDSATGTKSTENNFQLEGTEPFALGIVDDLQAGCNSNRGNESPGFNSYDFEISESTTYSVEYTNDESIYNDQTGKDECHRIALTDLDRATVIGGGDFATVSVSEGTFTVTPNDKNLEGVVEIELVHRPMYSWKTLRRTIRVYIKSASSGMGDGYVQVLRADGSLTGEYNYNDIHLRIVGPGVDTGMVAIGSRGASAALPGICTVDGNFFPMDFLFYYKGQVFRPNKSLVGGLLFHRLEDGVVMFGFEYEAVNRPDYASADYNDGFIARIHCNDNNLGKVTFANACYDPRINVSGWLSPSKSAGSRDRLCSGF